VSTVFIAFLLSLTILHKSPSVLWHHYFWHWVFIIWQQDVAEENGTWSKVRQNWKSMIRWMCRFTVKERKKNTDLRELLELEPMILVFKKGILKWFGPGFILGLW